MNARASRVATVVSAAAQVRRNSMLVSDRHRSRPGPGMPGAEGTSHLRGAAEAPGRRVPTDRTQKA
ncbi:hypothetical protein SVEN_1900 [Streptomyces venezuelae ATCC 10712]|uniref:Uncharacterized protein n=1 Tax=Streptomyces venezuelae (strain ATCC 10712 / CBS 650.69 / DSM 40230 / JCM 4526 / NBRC 13096 / PD 04745) TaxID=953739 RepID=F2RJH7_STRVP|nr:hypothetical protein SVEN_1900 [Streptomyces venezuelae ATCC 10712]